MDAGKAEDHRKRSPGKAQPTVPALADARLVRRPTDAMFKRENSRAPARKGHEPQAFLTIGEPDAETLLVQDINYRHALADGYMKRSITAPAAVPSALADARLSHKESTPVTAAAGAPAGSHSASSMRSSSRFNESFTSFERPAARSSRHRAEQQPLVTPEAVSTHVRAPFKQDITRGPSSVMKKAVSPSAGLREATLMATMEVSRALKEEAQNAQILLEAAGSGFKREPRLLKAPMQPLVAVRLAGPRIEQCRGVQAAPSLTPQHAPTDFDQNLESQAGMRIKSSVMSRPATEARPRTSAVGSGPPPTRSAMRKISAKGPAEIEVKESPAPRNSVSEDGAENEPEVSPELKQSYLNVGVHIPSGHNSIGSKSRSSQSQVGVDQGLHVNYDKNTMSSSRGSSRSPSQGGRGYTFLTENVGTELVASAPDPAAAGSSTAHFMDDDRSSHAGAGSADDNPVTLKQWATEVEGKVGQPPGDHLVGERSKPVEGDHKDSTSSASHGTRHSTVVPGQAGFSEVSVCQDSSLSMGAAACLVSRSETPAAQEGLRFERVTSEAVVPATTCGVDSVAFPEVMERPPSDKAAGKLVRCKDAADMSVHNHQDDEEDDEGGDIGGKALQRRQPAEGEGHVVLPPSVQSSVSTGSSDNHAKEKDETGDCSHIPDFFCTNEKRFSTLQAQLSTIIAVLRDQHHMFDVCATASSMDAIVHEATEQEAPKGCEFGATLCVSTKLAAAAAAARCPAPAPTSPGPLRLERITTAADENLSLSLFANDDDADGGATSEDSAVMLNRFHQPADIYKDLFYHGWGCTDLPLSCLSSCLTHSSGGGKSRLCRRKNVVLTAWADSACDAGAAEASQWQRYGHHSRAANRPSSAARQRTDEEQAAELRVQALLPTSGDIWIPACLDDVPPPVCFNINCKPPEGSFYYFSYGMHMNPHRLSASLGRSAENVLRLWGLLFGFQLMFNKKGIDKLAGLFPNIEYNPFSSVEGCVYQLAESELPLIDGYHGCPEHYARIVLPVWLVNCLDPDNYGVAQYCVPAVTYVAQDNWVCNAVESNHSSQREYSVRQCLKAADLLTTNYKQQLLAMCTR